jgi:hypothetical protein
MAQSGAPNGIHFSAIVIPRRGKDVDDATGFARISTVNATARDNREVTRFHRACLFPNSEVHFTLKQMGDLFVRMLMHRDFGICIQLDITDCATVAVRVATANLATE